ncbi:MAG: DUF4111 domain-containing protein [Pseudomonadaceae bacterium]|nr:DUF4111 domain-containing protein [Pseudomonadaceae bacterium]
MPTLQSATDFPALNAVLEHLLTNAQNTLGSNFVGAYLQGSFAIGDFSEFSDCDFIVVTNVDLSLRELAALQQLHKDIQQLPLPYWPINIEGSYAPKDILRRWTLEPRDPPGETRNETWADPGMGGSPARCYPFWYLDHGSDTLVRSEHDNTQVVRWTLREHGVRLAGPAITQLIEPVTAAHLRREVRETIDIAIASGLAMPMFAWQAFWVGLFCRILHTIETGRVTSKKEAMSWAQASLQERWQGLIKHSLSLRKGDDEQAAAPADERHIRATREFAVYSRETADQMLAGQ